MECRDIQRKISAYMDGELDLGTVRNLEHHISRCGTCREIAADFQNIDNLVRSLPKLDMAPESPWQSLEVVLEPRNATVEEGLHRSPIAAAMRFMSSLVDLMETRKSSTHMLDEFDDFPPLSLGSIYFKMLDQPGQG